MQTQTAAEETGLRSDVDPTYANLLEGYRFRVCETANEVREALDVRRKVYCVDGAYSIPCPDEYDHRSWLLRAEIVETGQCVGTMRLTPHFAGSFEAEEYFELPRRLRTPRNFEISRFAILPEYRRDKTPVPAVAFGLFRLVCDMAKLLGTRLGVVCSKPERSWTYTCMGWQPIGLTASYAKLNGATHEVLIGDFVNARDLLYDNPFKTLLFDADFAEVIAPTKRPPLGLVPDTHEFRYAVGA